MATTYQYRFKGDDLENLYRIEGRLTAASPIHIGTGEYYQDEIKMEEWRKKKAKGEATEEDQPPKIDKIERDVHGLPLIPGSALRGVVRHYLLGIFRSFQNGKIAKDPDYERSPFKEMDQNGQIKYMQEEASLLEQLMGTPFCESKIEFWDADLLQKADGNRYKAKGWDQDRQSYVVQSVAINPITGAAERNKLYSFDVAPAGLQFRMNIVGRNLSARELGMLLFGLGGFNSLIYPLTIGAMAGRGFGRMEFKLEAIYRLTSSNNELLNWIKLASSAESAGYHSLDSLKLNNDMANTLINTFKSEFNFNLEEKKL
jgi:CRISPR/Cas system CSM-associated protein Csm3 (group 7 of RAMP superfamily)